jgi:hypothetical protein
MFRTTTTACLAYRGVMRSRSLQLLLLAAIVVSTPLPAAPQTGSAKWTTPRTPWGDPDLQGIWPSSHMVRTPMERDPKLGTRAVLNDEEYARRMAQVKGYANIETLGSEKNVPVSGTTWMDPGTANRQASLVVDPPDGRIPALTPEAQSRESARLARFNTKKDAPDTWEDLSTWDRCITLGAVGSMLPFYYNNGVEIVQAPGYVVIRNEMVHEARVIPLDGRPHAGSAIRTWMGDSRGRWEGTTLVVETTNFNARVGVGPGDGGVSDPAPRPTGRLRISERFTRTDDETVEYKVTIEDPNTWTKPWTIAYPLRREANYQFLSEYACHEGNLFIHNVMSAARAQEQ